MHIIQDCSITHFSLKTKVYSNVMDLIITHKHIWAESTDPKFHAM